MNSEYQKLITLAKSTQQRFERNQGAAVRCVSGRTYVATEVIIGDWALDALEVALAQAISSGSEKIEAFFTFGKVTSERALKLLGIHSPEAYRVSE